MNVKKQYSPTLSLSLKGCSVDRRSRNRAFCLKLNRMVSPATTRKNSMSFGLCTRS